MKAVTVILVAVLAVAGTASFAYAGPGFGPGPMGGFARDPELMLEHMTDHLDLTDDQQAAIANIIEANRAEGQAIREQLKANRQAIQALDPADASYEAELNNIALSNGELATAGTLLAVRVKSEVKAVLTDEQIEKLQRGKERMKKRFKKRFDRG